MRVWKCGRKHTSILPFLLPIFPPFFVFGDLQSLGITSNCCKGWWAHVIRMASGDQTHRLKLGVGLEDHLTRGREHHEQKHKDGKMLSTFWDPQVAQLVRMSSTWAGDIGDESGKADLDPAWFHMIWVNKIVSCFGILISCAILWTGGDGPNPCSS